MDFAGKTAVVTGAASGACKATALAFGQAGANVALFDIDEEGAQKVADQIDSTGATVMVRKVDMAKPDQVRAALQDVNARFGRLDAVANVAAIYPRATVPEVTEDFWDLVHDIDLRGVFFCCQEAMRIMVAQGSGAIVNVASSVVWRPLEGHVAYAAAKGGLVAMSRILAIECARKGVRVNMVAPGHIAGGRQIQGALAEKGLSISTEVGRSVTPEEIASSILFLCSDAASGVNGAIVNVSMGNYMPAG
jgi:NAD(P)-dependent dehydrogenase (short-subunit alcohol dehydrogenase family)